MKGLLLQATAVATTLLATACAPPAVAPGEVSVRADDRSSIYRGFLDTWTEHGKATVNVSMLVVAPSPAEMKAFADCASAGGNTPELLPPEPVADLGEALRGLQYVHLVDKARWTPRDPADLIRQGQPVEPAVESGFAHGLMSFSAIAFDPARTTAVFSYSFVCGGLCGHGATVVFRHVGDGWQQTRAECGNWIS